MMGKKTLVEGSRIREGTHTVPPPPASREFIKAHTLLGKYETPPLLDSFEKAGPEFMHNVWRGSSVLGETQAFIEWVFEDVVYLLDYLP